MGFKSRAKQKRRESARRQEEERIATTTPEERDLDIIHSVLLPYSGLITHPRMRELKPACVQDSAAIARLLRKKGMEAEVICTDVCAFNTNYKESVLAGKGEAKQHHRKPMAYAVELHHEQDIGGGGHDGHAIVRTEHFLIDPTAGQLNREDRLTVMPIVLIPIGDIGELDPEFEWMTHRRFDVHRVQPRQGLEWTEDFDDGLIRGPGLKQKQHAILTMPEDTWVVYSLRPDISIEDVYPRWGIPDFDRNVRSVMRVVNRISRETKKRNHKRNAL